MPTPRPRRGDGAEWFVDFEGTCHILTGSTLVTAAVSPIPARASGGPSIAKGRRKLYIRNHVTVELEGRALFVGGNDVTVDNGYPVNPNELLELNVTERVRVFGVTFTDFDPVEVRTLEIV